MLNQMRELQLGVLRKKLSVHYMVQILQYFRQVIGHIKNYLLKVSPVIDFQFM